MNEVPQSLDNAPLLNIEGLYRDLGKVMIVAPHPDDESLGCGGLIAQLRAQNAEVSILFMTNGEASHPNSIVYPPNKLAELRKREANRAAEILGVKEDRLIFLNAGDGRLQNLENEDKVVEQLAVIINNEKPDTLFIPWRRDHHSDHLATNKLVYKATKEMELLIAEYPVWLWKKGRVEDWPKNGEVLPYKLPVKSVKTRKFEAIMAHASQTTRLINDDPEGFILTQELLQPFLREYEYFFFPNKEKPSVDKSYFRELFLKDPDPWNFETSSYEKAKYENILKVLPSRKYRNALEIGCANGVFTSLFAPQCEQYLGLELDGKALEKAKERCAELSNCKLLQWDVKNGLPLGKYDIILFCEVGYYFEKKKLQQIFRSIYNALQPEGYLVMTHWTPFVRSYALTGLQVHETFEKEYSTEFQLYHSQRKDLYELKVWKKLRNKPPVPGLHPL
jgi:LmbE family N-acetylglucosaminyl deacetylase/protein-L-isoaspartate O-methyltransferase